MQNTQSNKLMHNRLQYAVRRPQKEGFTLIELALVVFIISLAASLIVPSLWETDRASLRSDVRRMSSTLRYVYNESVGRKTPYILSMDLDNGTWGFRSSHETRRFALRRDRRIRDVIIPSHGEVNEGEVTMEFGPLGPDEPLTLHLEKNDIVYTIMFNHLNGRSVIHEGYRL